MPRKPPKIEVEVTWETEESDDPRANDAWVKADPDLASENSRVGITDTHSRCSP